MKNMIHITMLIVMIILIGLGLMLAGCTTLHERLCEATVKHYEEAPQSSEADVYFGHYNGVCAASNLPLTPILEIE